MLDGVLGDEVCVLVDVLDRGWLRDNIISVSVIDKDLLHFYLLPVIIIRIQIIIIIWIIELIHLPLLPIFMLLLFRLFELLLFLFDIMFLLVLFQQHLIRLLVIDDIMLLQLQLLIYLLLDLL